MARKKFYWVGLKLIIDKLCRYYKRWGSLLPSDLPAEVTALLALVEAACAAMAVYDKAKKQGGPKDDS